MHSNKLHMSLGCLTNDFCSKVVDELVQKHQSIPQQLRKIEELIEGTSTGSCQGKPHPDRESSMDGHFQVHFMNISGSSRPSVYRL